MLVRQHPAAGCLTHPLNHLVFDDEVNHFYFTRPPHICKRNIYKFNQKWKTKTKDWNGGCLSSKCQQTCSLEAGIHSMSHPCVLLPIASRRGAEVSKSIKSSSWVCGRHRRPQHARLLDRRSGTSLLRLRPNLNARESGNNGRHVIHTKTICCALRPKACKLACAVITRRRTSPPHWRAKEIWEHWVRRWRKAETDWQMTSQGSNSTDMYVYIFIETQMRHELQYLKPWGAWLSLWGNCSAPAVSPASKCL